MQLVLSNNRVLAYGENCFLAMGGTVICEANGKAYQNATVAETDSPLPSDIDTVGYEYHAGVFVPCAPYGKGAGAVMVACEDCGTPKSSKVTIDEDGKLIGALAPDEVVEALGLEAGASLIDAFMGIERTLTATVTTTWKNSGNYYYQDIAVSGILATDTPIVDILPGSDTAANKIYSDSICKVISITTSNGSIRVWAVAAITTAFPIQIKVVR